MLEGKLLKQPAQLVNTYATFDDVFVALDMSTKYYTLRRVDSLDVAQSSSIPPFDVKSTHCIARLDIDARRKFCDVTAGVIGF